MHDQNTSRWMEYHEHEGSQFAVKLCIGCKRVSEMMLASARKNKKDELEATISRQDAIRYIKSADASREAWIPGLLENGDIHEDWK